MKIGLVLDDGLDTPDGVQQYVLQVGAWLSSQGHDVHYLVGQTRRTDVANVHSMSKNLRVRFNGNRMSMPLPTSRGKLQKFLEQQKFDVLHVQVPYSPFMAGQLLSVVPDNVAVVGTFHILPYGKVVTAANRALGKINHFSAQRFDAMLAVSEPAQHFAARDYGYHKPIEVLPNPVRLSQFEDIESMDPNLNIVFLGRLVPRKGALQLLQAVAYMHENEMFKGDYRVIIGGKGPLLSELARFSNDHHIADRVVFPGFLDEAEKAEFLARADVAVFPSLAGESFGIVLLEAMAASRGVVLAGNNPGYTSVMQPYPDQLFDPLNTRAFAEKLTWYLDHDIARSRASELQHQYVQHFDIAKVGAELVDVYKRALQTRAHS